MKKKLYKCTNCGRITETIYEVTFAKLDRKGSSPLYCKVCLPKMVKM